MNFKVVLTGNRRGRIHCELPGASRMPLPGGQHERSLGEHKRGDRRLRAVSGAKASETSRSCMKC